MARESKRKDAPFRVVNDVRFTMPTDGVEMLAILAREDGDEVHLRDLDGTWIVRREDILHREPWKDAPDGVKGKAVRVRIRADATVRQVREFKLLPSDRPLTLPDSHGGNPFVGQVEMARIGREWAGKLGFTPGDNPFDNLTHTTVCCWGTGEFGVDCSADDTGKGLG